MRHAAIVFAILAAFVTGCRRSATDSRTSTAPTIEKVQQSVHAMPLDDVTFDAEISNGHGVAIVDFYANWCGPCKVMLPVLDELAADATDAKVAKINIDVAKATTAKFEIHAIPCLIVFKDGKEVERHTGGHGKEEVTGWIAKYTEKNVSAATPAR